MKRRSLIHDECPIARAVERVGDWWNILILRDCLQGLGKFDELQESLGIATNMLSRRLGGLVEAGLLEKRPYQTRPVRHLYVLTDTGRDFAPVIAALLAWGNRNFAPDGARIQLADAATGAVLDPVVVDRASGRPITAATSHAVAGPSASPGLAAGMARRGLLRHERGRLSAGQPSDGRGKGSRPASPGRKEPVKPASGQTVPDGPGSVQLAFLPVAAPPEPAPPLPSQSIPSPRTTP